MRYIVDKRNGCVAVIDTEHPRYKDPDYRSNGLDPDLAYVVKYWGGLRIPGTGQWTISPMDVETAEKLADELNKKELAE